MKRNGAPFLWNGCAVLAEYASESEKHEIEMDIKNAEIYLRNSEIEKHKKIKTTQPEYFDGIRSIPINQIEVPPCFKKNRPAEKKIDSMIEYYNVNFLDN